MMHGVPQSMDEVSTLVKSGQYGDTTAVITAGLQNWAQELLDEGAEGSYFTAKIEANTLHISDISGVEVATVQTQLNETFVANFERDARGTLLFIQNALRHLIDTHQLQL